jgi:hypothetical protein
MRRVLFFERSLPAPYMIGVEQDGIPPPGKPAALGSLTARSAEQPGTRGTRRNQLRIILNY